MEIVVHGRNVEVPEHYRQLVGEKLSRLERYDHKLIGVDVELTHEKNRRQSDAAQRVEITCTSRGPLIRAEASAADFYAALDIAVNKLEARMRRAADRRRIHHGRHVPTSVHAATGETPPVPLNTEHELRGRPATATATLDPEENLPGRVVREKEHPGEPMTIDDALLQMELVGHDFYLFKCVETGRASVVYRRQGYDYGLLRLTP